MYFYTDDFERRRVRSSHGSLAGGGESREDASSYSVTDVLCQNIHVLNGYAYTNVPAEKGLSAYRRVSIDKPSLVGKHTALRVSSRFKCARACACMSKHTYENVVLILP